MEVQTLLQDLQLQYQLQDASSLVCHAMPVVPTMKTKQLYKTTMNDTNDGIV
jgi:hypothetical protein